MARLLLVGLGRAVEGLSAEDFFEEAKECVRPLQVGPVDPQRHRVGQPQRHGLPPSKEKRRGVERGGGILANNDRLISPLSPFFAEHYLIAE